MADIQRLRNILVRLEPHRTFSHSGKELESQTIQHGGSRVTETGSSGAVEGNRVTGSTMQDAFKENQSKLHEQSGRNFEPQNDIQRRVAEQRSENEHKINESAGKLEKTIHCSDIQ
jgi:conjugal transfer mating pair stabilization protein TraG